MCQVGEIARGVILKAETSSKHLVKGATVKVVSVYNKLPTFTVEIRPYQYLIIDKAECENFSVVE